MVDVALGKERIEEEAKKMRGCGSYVEEEDSQGVGIGGTKERF
jgi:hypothetical protein